jgi:hypothetical protein
MKNSAPAGTPLLMLMLFAFAGSLTAVAQEPALLAVPDKAASPFRMKDPLIEKAVRETLAESKEEGKDPGKERALFAAKPTPGGDRY